MSWAPVWQTFLCPNIFEAPFLQSKTILGQTLVFVEENCTKKIVMAPNFFGSKNFWGPKCWGRNIFWPNFFLPPNSIRVKFFYFKFFAGKIRYCFGVKKSKQYFGLVGMLTGLCRKQCDVWPQLIIWDVDCISWDGKLGSSVAKNFVFKKNLRPHLFSPTLFLVHHWFC